MMGQLSNAERAEVLRAQIESTTMECEALIVQSDDKLLKKSRGGVCRVVGLRLKLENIDGACGGGSGGTPPGGMS